MTQVQAAELLGITQQEVSSLKNNRLSNFSVGRLFELIVALGQDVEIAIRPSGNSRGDIALIQRPGSSGSLLLGLARFRSLFVRSPKEDH